jgi:hypothetical protein
MTMPTLDEDIEEFFLALSIPVVLGLWFLSEFRCLGALWKILLVSSWRCLLIGGWQICLHAGRRGGGTIEYLGVMDVASPLRDQLSCREVFQQHFPRKLAL